MKINRILAIVSVLASVLTVSCTKDETLTAMGLDQNSVNIFVGQTATVTPDFTPSGAKADVVWTSSDESVATVQGGYVTGIKAGSATITAKAETFTSTCAVTVSNVKATAVILSKTSLTLYEGEPGETLSASVEPYNVTFPAISWSSTDQNVVTVVDGHVEPVALGTAKVIAALADGTKAECNVKVTLRVPTSPETLTLYKSDKAGYRGLFGAASDNGKTAGTDGWLSYNDGVATWTANTTGKPRKATLTLSTGSELTVVQIEAKDMAGDYTFYNYSFKALSNTKVINQNGRMHETAVQFVPVEKPEMLNGHEHNLDLVGLYYDFKLPVSLEIDAKGNVVVYTYMSLDYQQVSTGDKVAIIPELTTNTTYGTGYFAVASFGPDDCNYAWCGWGTADLFSANPKITIGTGDQRKVSDGRWFCGFSIVKTGYTAYTTIYQLNYKNVWVYGENGGAYFSMK